MWKKALYMLLCACMILALAVRKVDAADIVKSGACGNNVSWTEYHDGTVIISGTGPMWNYSVIPTPDSPWSMTSAIRTVKIEEGVTSIGSCAFGWMFGLKTLYIPKSVTAIESDAFNNSRMITDIYYAGGEEDWNNIRIAFGNYSLSSAHIHYHVGDMQEKSGTCGPELSWRLSADGTLVISGTGGMDDFSGGGENVAPWYPYKKSIKQIIIESGVTSTGYCAFWECTEVTSVSLPDTLTSIGGFSFALCTSLRWIEIPASVTDIGFSAFGACYALRSVRIPDGMKEIKGQIFYECSKLESVTIPDSVTAIGDIAFGECPNLTDVYFGGNREQWKAVTVGDGNEALRNATIHFGGSGEEDRKYKVYCMGGYELFDISLEDCMSKTAASEYNPQLAHMLIAMCNAVNDDSDIYETMNSFGMQGKYRVGGIFLTYSIGVKDLEDGEKLVLIVIRGTKDMLEWVSNMDAGINDDGEHGGFSDAARELRKKLNEYLGTDDYSGLRFVITGFSRGAGVGNILAQYLLEKGGVREADLYAYNFACPDVGHVDEAGSVHPNIFNISDATDLVSWVPRSVLGDEWGKYGRSLWFYANWNDDQKLKIGTDAHDETKYLAFLRGEPSCSGFRKRDETKRALDSATDSRRKRSIGGGVNTVIRFI